MSARNRYERADLSRNAAAGALDLVGQRVAILVVENLRAILGESRCLPSSTWSVSIETRMR